MGFLNDALYVLDTPGALTRGLLAGTPGKRKSGREMLERLGAVGAPRPGVDRGDVAGFLADVVLDPVNLLGGWGAAKGLKLAARAAKARKIGQGAEIASKARAAMPAATVAEKATPSLAEAVGMQEAVPVAEAVKAVEPVVPPASTLAEAVGTTARKTRAPRVGKGKPRPAEAAFSKEMQESMDRMAVKPATQTAAAAIKPWQAEAVAQAAPRTAAGSGQELPEFFAELQKKFPDLTPAEFKQGMLELRKAGRLRLDETTGKWAGKLEHPLSIKEPDWFDEDRGYGLLWYVRGPRPNT